MIETGAATKKELVVKVAPAREAMINLVYQTEISNDLIEGLIEALDSVLIGKEDFPVGIGVKPYDSEICPLEREIHKATEYVMRVNNNLAAIMEKLRI